MTIRYVLGAVVALASTSALANWNYAQWGQSPEQLIASADGSAAAVQAQENQRIYNLDYLARANTTWHGIPVEVRFHFTTDTKKLAAIKLTPTNDAQCDEMRAAALAEFGTGQIGQEMNESDYPNLHFTQNLDINWSDSAHGNRVKMFDVAASDLHFCHVIYRPI